jgi:hypothetical protein
MAVSGACHVNHSLPHEVNSYASIQGGISHRFLLLTHQQKLLRIFGVLEQARSNHFAKE